MSGTRLFAGTCAAVLMSIVSTTSADTLSIAEKLNSNAVVPQRGMTMEMVESRFGAPASRNLPVGEPPITRWHYEGFKVYFEHEYVIHSVAN